MNIEQSGCYAFLSTEPCAIEMLFWPEAAKARDCFEKRRGNGEEQDNPEGLNLTFDGGIEWIVGQVDEDGDVYGEKNSDGRYAYTLRYNAGPQDLAYFEAKDRKYLTRLLVEGRLREQEPAVWYMYKMDECPQDIGEWWSRKLALPNLNLILARAELAESAFDGKTFEGVRPQEAIKKVQSGDLQRFCASLVASQWRQRAAEQPLSAKSEFEAEGQQPPMAV